MTSRPILCVHVVDHGGGWHDIAVQYPDSSMVLQARVYLAADEAMSDAVVMLGGWLRAAIIQDARLTHPEARGPETPDMIARAHNEALRKATLREGQNGDV